MKSQNSPKYFPNLNLDFFEDYAKEWVKQYPRIINRIVLYPHRSKYPKETERLHGVPIKYDVLFEIKARLNKTSRKLISATQYYDTVKGDYPFSELIDAQFTDVYRRSPADRWRDEWNFIPQRSNQRLYKGDDDKCWILFDCAIPEKDSHALVGLRSFPCKPGTKWEDISITLIADDAVTIETPQRKERFTYHELRMSDKRAGDKPTLIWALTKLFAKNSGFISSQNPNYDRQLPDTAKRLNKHLKELFGIYESIYVDHYKKEKAYRTKINFRNRTF